jgi:hypothetical protein
LTSDQSAHKMAEKAVGKRLRDKNVAKIQLD